METEADEDPPEPLNPAQVSLCGALGCVFWSYLKTGSTYKCNGKLWINPADWERGPQYVSNLPVVDIDARIAARRAMI